MAERTEHLTAPSAEATIATMAAIRTAASALLNASDDETLTLREAQELSGTLVKTVMEQLAAVMTSAGAEHGWPAARVDHDASVGEYDAIMEFPAAADDEDGGPFVAIWLYESGLQLLDSRGYAESGWLDCPAELLQAMARFTRWLTRYE